MKKNILGLAIASVLGLSLIGCGGSSSTDPATDTSANGVAVDGLLSGMFCYADKNDNGLFDGDDVAATGLTKVDGSYEISGQGVVDSAIVCRAEEGSKDVATGEAFTGQLSAPAGSKAVSPVTTMVKLLGEAQARTILGITDTNIDLTSNPLENATLAKAAVQVQATVKVIVAALKEQTGNASGVDLATERAMVAATFKALATASENATASVLTDTTVLAAAVTAATKAVTNGETTENADASVIATAVKTVVDRVATEYDAIIDAGTTGTALADLLNSAQLTTVSNDAISTEVPPTTVTITVNVTTDDSELPATVDTGTGTGTTTNVDTGSL